MCVFKKLKKMYSIYLKKFRKFIYNFTSKIHMSAQKKHNASFSKKIHEIVFILPFYSILNEFKLRIFYSIFSLFITFLVCYLNSEKIIYSMCKPFLMYIKNNNAQIYLHDKSYTYNYINLIFIDIYEAFYTNIFISFFWSFYLIMPLLIYQLWCFFIPSFYNKNKNTIVFNFLIFLFLVYLGIFLVNNFFLEKLLYFFLNFNINNLIINVNYMPRLKSYILLYTKLLFVFTFICMVPFIFLFFVKKYAKIYFKKENLKKKNTFAILYKNKFKNVFFMVIVSSIIAPPDIIIQLVLAFLLNIFLEICICIIFIFVKF